MQCIVTKFLPWTSTKPARIKATNSTKSHSVTVLVGNNNSHKIVCEKLRAALGWTAAQGYPRMIPADLDNNTVVWVFVWDNTTVSYHHGIADN